MGCSAAPRTELAPGVFTANEAPSFISPISLRHLPSISPHPTTNPNPTQAPPQEPISPISPLYLAYTSPISPLYLPNPTQAPPQEPIPLHHEMAQCDVRPTYVAFHCVTPATQGGATPIIPSRAVAAHLRQTHPGVAERLAAEGVLNLTLTLTLNLNLNLNLTRTRTLNPNPNPNPSPNQVRYVRVLPEEHDPTSPIGKPWTACFNTSSREEAEIEMAAQVRVRVTARARARLT